MFVMDNTYHACTVVKIRVPTCTVWEGLGDPCTVHKTNKSLGRPTQTYRKMRLLSRRLLRCQLHSVSLVLFHARIDAEFSCLSMGVHTSLVVHLRLRELAASSGVGAEQKEPSLLVFSLLYYPPQRPRLSLDAFPAWFSCADYFKQPDTIRLHVNYREFSFGVPLRCTKHQLT